jgi:hypothetical protein
MDINNDQKHVLPIEKELAIRTIESLDQQLQTVTVITFGSRVQTVGSLNAGPTEAIELIKNVSVDTDTKYSPITMYEAIHSALDTFTDNPGAKSLLIITEGKDYVSTAVHKHITSKAEQLHATCNVAMVADHSFYGTKGLRRYGFNLPQLTRKTHGKLVEVGDNKRKVALFAKQLSDQYAQ